MRGELEKAIEREWRRTQRRLEPIIRAEVAKSGLMDPDFAVAVNVSQNVLKDCLSVTMNHAMPQGIPYFVEIATRLARRRGGRDLMAALYWHKACPGDYYLYAHPKPADGRVARPMIGRVRRQGAGYDSKVDYDGLALSIAGMKGTPDSCIRRFQGMIEAFTKTSHTFKRENF